MSLSMVLMDTKELQNQPHLAFKRPEIFAGGITQKFCVRSSYVSFARCGFSLTTCLRFGMLAGSGLVQIR